MTSLEPLKKPPNLSIKECSALAGNSTESTSPAFLHVLIYDFQLLASMRCLCMLYIPCALAYAEWTSNWENLFLSVLSQVSFTRQAFFHSFTSEKRTFQTNIPSQIWIIKYHLFFFFLSFTKIIRGFSLHYFYQELSIKQNNHIPPLLPWISVLLY